ncbi:hypothetical protein Val02_37980 [Virgisporangium aliadipatigenens]|uniref:Uncharacterized protein n=1 Tax=Virgisporangium aliadipatigenens TaxID=741659 RepID=A0A8J3YMA8_9ACTN|nr:hypothetical protein [Virgisporangium aliadipatigenens]GIJ46912.1 hypothetical protein Val02_37980 [Virgisporangium aliadipatigenens]
MTTTIDAIRAEALFVSCLQASQRPEPEQVRDAVEGSLRKLGADECITRVAVEFGEHPDIAVRRMCWCLDAVRSAFATEGVVSLPKAA